MIERLQTILPYLEHRPPETQEEVAMYIEALAEMFDCKSSNDIQQIGYWEDPARAWNDLHNAMLEDLDQHRHSVPPTPPLELL